MQIDIEKKLWIYVGRDFMIAADGRSTIGSRERGDDRCWPMTSVPL